MKQTSLDKKKGHRRHVKDKTHIYFSDQIKQCIPLIVIVSIMSLRFGSRSGLVGRRFSEPWRQSVTQLRPVPTPCAPH